ncbi:MAG: psbV [Planctomycetaceae bacterium]|nr:psbV [Planctomycetaceae bacterium]
MGLVLTLCLASFGCRRQVEPSYSPAPLSTALERDDLKQQIAAFLTKECGTFAAPKLFDAPEVPIERLKSGQQIYMLRCVQCHGVTGGGDGVAAVHLSPRPRDYRQGIFKFTSTPYGSKPRREDLVRTVSRGIPGTSMPSFRLLNKREVSDVVDYVLSLTPRGELETFLANEAKASDELPEDTFTDAVDNVRGRWRDARQQTIIAMTREPAFTHEMVEAGRKAFQAAECSKCHGADGRGAFNAEVNLDAWGQPSKAADLTSGMLRGGATPADIYRRIYGGINGTRMPGHDNVFKDKPDAIWELVAYVMSVSNRRREGDIPLADRTAPAPALAVPQK